MKIKGIEKITAVYNDWHPSDIALIKAIEWSVNEVVIVGYSQSRQGVASWPDESKDYFEISISFRDIQDFTLQLYGKGLHQVMGFDIKDLSGDGLEKINFHILDYEDGSIDFYCEEIEINHMSGPVKISAGFNKPSIL